MVAALLLGGIAHGQMPDEAVELDHPAIAYAAPAVRNPVARLSDRLANGEVALRYDTGAGYLRSILSALDVPVE